MIIGGYRFANSDNNISTLLAALRFGGANFAILIGYGIRSHFRWLVPRIRRRRYRTVLFHDPDEGAVTAAITR
jgi:hypothetical protein